MKSNSFSPKNCKLIKDQISLHTCTIFVCLRYKFTPDAFNFSDTQNKCFCPKIDGSRVCPPAGLFNISACNYGSPLLSSFPHFYGADKSLLKQIDGLNPRQEDHESYVDIHPVCLDAHLILEYYYVNGYFTVIDI